jgi:hypothetical protein
MDVRFYAKQGAGNGLRLVILMFGLLLSACASINDEHPQLMTGELKSEAKGQLARVYFIRPKVYKTKGVANDPVRITFQGKPLLSQDEGNYSLLYLKPSRGTLKIHSKTLFTNQRAPVDVWRARQYKFIAGKTYFVYVKQVDEEFRGIFYEPQPVSLREAKQLILLGDGRYDATRATGAARDVLIGDLLVVNIAPASAVKSLAPALPENIYPQEKYLHRLP